MSCSVHPDSSIASQKRSAREIDTQLTPRASEPSQVRSWPSSDRTEYSSCGSYWYTMNGGSPPRSKKPTMRSPIRRSGSGSGTDHLRQALGGPVDADRRPSRLEGKCPNAVCSVNEIQEIRIADQPSPPDGRSQDRPR